MATAGTSTVGVVVPAIKSMKKAAGTTASAVLLPFAESPERKPKQVKACAPATKAMKMAAGSGIAIDSDTDEDMPELVQVLPLWVTDPLRHWRRKEFMMKLQRKRLEKVLVVKRRRLQKMQRID